MLSSTLNQPDIFLAMFVCGAALGAWSDLVRRVSALTGPGRLLTFFMDLLSVSGMFFLLLFAMLKSGRLEMRLFAFLSAAAGMGAYLFTVPPAVDAVVHNIKKAFGRLCMFHNFKKIFQFLCR